MQTRTESSQNPSTGCPVPPAWLSSTAWAPAQFCFAPISSDFKHSLAFQPCHFYFFLLERSLKSNNLQFKMGLPISSHPDFTGPVCPSQLEKNFCPFAPQPVPQKHQENLTKWDWSFQRAAGLGSHGTNPAPSPAPRQHPSAGTCPHQVAARDGDAAALREEAGTAASWDSPHRPQGLQEGFPHVQFYHHILLLVGVWAGGCC